MYMALFEMAPPHAHGRLQNLKCAALPAPPPPRPRAPPRRGPRSRAPRGAALSAGAPRGRYALAFTFGLCSAYLADAFEESMHPHRQQQQQQAPLPYGQNIRIGASSHHEDVDYQYNHHAAWLLRFSS